MNHGSLKLLVKAWSCGAQHWCLPDTKGLSACNCSAFQGSDRAASRYNDQLPMVYGIMSIYASRLLFRSRDLRDFLLRSGVRVSPDSPPNHQTFSKRSTRGRDHRAAFDLSLRYRLGCGDIPNGLCFADRTGLAWVVVNTGALSTGHFRV